MHQGIPPIPWQIFAQFSEFGTDIIWPKSDSFLLSIGIIHFAAMLHFMRVWSESGRFEPSYHLEGV